MMVRQHVCAVQRNQMQRKDQALFHHITNINRHRMMAPADHGPRALAYIRGCQIITRKYKGLRNLSDFIRFLDEQPACIAYGITSDACA